MKEIALKRIFTLLIILAGTSQTAYAHVIYGLNQARNFYKTSNTPYFVQVGTFKSYHNASQLKSTIASQINYPISVRNADQLYSVVIGPLSSSKEVRSVGQVRIQPIKRGQSEHLSEQEQVTNPSVPNELSKDKEIVPSRKNSALPLVSLNHGAWYVAVESGAAFSFSNHFITVPNGSNYPGQESLDQYSTSKLKQLELGLQVGHRWVTRQKVVPAYALAMKYQHLFNKNIKGSITEYSIPGFTNYDYRWDVSTDVFGLYSKIDLIELGFVMPYIDAGLGVSFNHANNYNEMALTGITPRVSSGYTSHTNRQLSYTLGAGFDVVLTPQVILSLGYEFQSFGRVSSGYGQSGSKWAGNQLSLGTFKTNTGLVGLAYIIDDL